MTLASTTHPVHPAARPVPFSTTVIGIDGEAGGRDAVALARLLAPRDARLVLAHVWQGTVGIARAAAGAEPPPHEARELLLRTRLDIGRACPMVVRRARSVAAGLHDIAEEEQAGLIAIGAHAAAGPGAPDAADAALSRPDCAVAVAPAGFAGRPVAISRVAVAMLGTDEHDPALEAGRRIARAHGACLELVRVLDPLVAVRPADERAWNAHAGQVRAGLKRLTADAVHLPEGDPVAELAAMAGDVDLMVLGARAHGAVRRLLLGSTVAAVARRTTGALLVVPRAV